MHTIGVHTLPFELTSYYEVKFRAFLASFVISAFWLQIVKRALFNGDFSVSKGTGAHSIVTFEERALEATSH